MPRPSMRRSIAIASDPSATAGLTPTLWQRGSVIRVGSFAGSEVRRIGACRPTCSLQAFRSGNAIDLAEGSAELVHVPTTGTSAQVGAVDGTVLKGQPLPRGLGRDVLPGASPLGCRSRLTLMAELLAELMARAASTNALTRHRDTDVCRKILSRNLPNFAENVP